MVTAGRRDLADVGHYRTSKEPMQIDSSRIGASKVHFEAPPSEHVSSEMNRVFAGFIQTNALNAGEPLRAITRAGIAHPMILGIVAEGLAACGRSEIGTIS